MEETDPDNRREQYLEYTHGENKLSSESSNLLLEIPKYLRKIHLMLEILEVELENTQPKNKKLRGDESSRRQNPRMEALHILALILTIIAALLTIIAYILGVF